MKSITKSGACERDSCGRCGDFGASEVHFTGRGRQSCRQTRGGDWPGSLINEEVHQSPLLSLSNRFPVT